MTIRNILLSFAIIFALTAMAIAQKAQTTERSRTQPLEVGQTAPDFDLAGHNGKKVRLSEVKKPTVLVFYRGYW